jgi:hypothetical protein
MAIDEARANKAGVEAYEREGHEWREPATAVLRDGEWQVASNMRRMGANFVAWTDATSGRVLRFVWYSR